jgi:hypothetical protein
MEQVSRNYHKVWFQFKGFVDQFLESSIKVFTPNLQAILCVAQVQVRHVNKAEGLQTPSPLKAYHLTVLNKLRNFTLRLRLFSYTHSKLSSSIYAALPGYALGFGVIALFNVWMTVINLILFGIFGGTKVNLG